MIEVTFVVSTLIKESIVKVSDLQKYGWSEIEAQEGVLKMSNDGGVTTVSLYIDYRSCNLYPQHVISKKKLAQSGVPKELLNVVYSPEITSSPMTIHNTFSKRMWIEMFKAMLPDMSNDEKTELFSLLSVNNFDELEKLVINGDEHTIQMLNMYFNNVWLMQL